MGSGDRFSMNVGRVIGNVVCTQKTPTLQGAKLLLIQPLSPSTMKAEGRPLVAVDAIGAGRDEIVLLAAGSSARQTEMTTGTPCDAVIMGIIDSIEAGGKNVFSKGSAG